MQISFSGASDYSIELVEMLYLEGKREFPCADGHCVEVETYADNDQ